MDLIRGGGENPPPYFFIMLKWTTIYKNEAFLEGDGHDG